MGRNKSAYQCIKKRKRKNNDALRKATQARLALLAARKYESEKKPEEEHELALAPATTSDCIHTKYSISDDNMSFESNLQEHELALAPPTTSDFTHTENSISDGNISLQSNVQDEDSDSSILVETGNASSLKEIVDVIDTIVGNRIINFRYFWKQIMTIAEHGEKFNCKLNYLKIVKEKQIEVRRRRSVCAESGSGRMHRARRRSGGLGRARGRMRARASIAAHAAQRGVLCELRASPGLCPSKMAA
ncbi:uncharacterized protein LOC121731887 [Aricia agestis]|uniref:uncharacterized protein LOC121731887 n=1 Tax=Aricia agestis TaxID=91739 RepID=UPI001C2053BF|nr:uncharacterized protein LOC121731887 [Aricia agestis]